MRRDYRQHYKFLYMIILFTLCFTLRVYSSLFYIYYIVEELENDICCECFIQYSVLNFNNYIIVWNFLLSLF